MGKSSRRRRRRKGRTQADPVPAGPAPRPPTPKRAEPGPGAGEVHRFLAAGKVKRAIAAAKATHKKYPSPETERQAARAYAARAREMLDRGQVQEAMDLVKMVEERFPAGRDEMAQARALAGLKGGGGGEQWAELADSDISADRKAELLDLIRGNVDDPAGLAQCESLPEEHPLRVQAAALAGAFDTVTRRPASWNDVKLLQVPRTSPLASWKLLVRAIAYFQAGRDDLCRRSLAGIEAETPPARAIPVMEAMLAGDEVRRMDKAATALAGKVLSAATHNLPDLLEDLEKTLEEAPTARIRAVARRAFNACRDDSPGILAELQHRTLVRGVLARVPVEQLLRDLAEPLKPHRRFWHLAAKAAEQADMDVCALLYWERSLDFYPGARSRREDGERTAILKRMVGLARHCGADEDDRDYFASKLVKRLKRPDAQQAFWPVDDKGKTDLQSRAQALLDPSALYRRWGEMTLDSAVFEEWLAWERGRSDGNWKRCDPAAEAWHRALPRDPAPLLYLARSAEKRGAFSKALGWLEEARRVQAPDAKLQAAHLRLLVAKTCRHLKQKKLHLAEADIDELKMLPQVEEGDQQAIPEALKWVLLRRAGNVKAAGAARGRLADTLGNRPAADLLCAGVAKAAGEKTTADLETGTGALPGGRSMISALNRIHPLCSKFGIDLALPSDWSGQLANHCNSNRRRIGDRSVRMLAALALQHGDKTLLYAASGAGLARGRHLERYLFYRACSMQAAVDQRVFTCWRLAAFLAGKKKDKELLEEMLAGVRRSPRRLRNKLTPLFRTTATLGSDEEVEEVAEAEAQAFDYPRRWWDDFRDGPYGTREAPCDCPVCRRSRGEYTEEDEDGYWENDYDEDDYDEDDYDEDDYDEGFAPLPTVDEIERELLDIANRYRLPDGTLPSLQELERLAPAPTRRLMLQLGLADPYLDTDGERISSPGSAQRERARQERKRKRKARKAGRKKRRK